MKTANFKRKTLSKRTDKLELHPRNPHRARYNFPLLADSSPELMGYLYTTAQGNLSLDFANPMAVKALNRALLNHFYGVAFWDIPAGFLCPPIPGRADYIHYIADLLADSNKGHLVRGRGVRLLDVGVGANCVYPIIANREYGWRCVGTDTNAIAVQAAKVIVQSNACLQGEIEIRLQAQASQMFTGIWSANERFDVTVCNPPFHASKAEMQAENQRKWRGLNKSASKSVVPAATAHLNFAGQDTELWCQGGEEGFIVRMIQDSQRVGERCYWFTSLVARHASLAGIYRALEQVGAVQVRTISMAQGQKISRFVAWSFLQPDQRDYWQDTYWLD